MDLLDVLLYVIKVRDWLALLVCGAIGFIAGFLVPAGWWSIFTSMLLSYHLFLGWFILSAERKMEIMRPISYPMTIHLACLVIIVCIGSGRIFVPHFDMLCCGVAVLAFFERDWLFEPVKAVAPGEQ